LNPDPAFAPDLPPAGAADALAPELVALLGAAIAPEPLAAASQARVRRRLLRRVAADSTDRHLTLAAGEGGWQPFGDGLTIKVLHESGGIMSYLLRLAPGAGLPAHRHPVDEECVVLEGEVRIGSLCLQGGGFHLGRQDVLHDDLHSPTGALIFLRGAVPEAALAL
jgi:anti-sigma factor ChrR (cupin superfamily)